MFKMLNPRRFYHAVGRRRFLEFVLLAVFVLFFYGPLLNMLMLAFANEYNVPHVLPEQWGTEWWGYVFGQESLVYFYDSILYCRHFHNNYFYGFLYSGCIFHC